MARTSGLARYAKIFAQPQAGAEQAQDDLIAFWSAHPWNYLTGRDTDGTPVVWTKDEGDRAQPVKPFPLDKPYLRRYLDLLMEDRPDSRIILVDKPRQMMFSTVTLLFAHWDCLFHPARRWLLSKTTEDEASEMLSDKIRYPHSRAPEWVRARLPLRDQPRGRAIYPKTGSYILAVAENVAEREARGGTASGVIVDEAARQATFESILAAVAPMASRVIAITTADIGTPGATAFRRLLDDARDLGVEED